MAEVMLHQLLVLPLLAFHVIGVATGCSMPITGSDSDDPIISSAASEFIHQSPGTTDSNHAAAHPAFNLYMSLALL